MSSAFQLPFSRKFLSTEETFNLKDSCHFLPKFVSGLAPRCGCEEGRLPEVQGVDRLHIHERVSLQGQPARKRGQIQIDFFRR